MPPAPSAKSQLDARRRLHDVLAPVVTAAGFDLEDIGIQKVGRRSIVRVVVDSDDGINLDGVALVSRAVSDVLDADPIAEAFGDTYVLEVSSPGVERALTEPRHWRRATGRLVNVTVDGAPVTARVVEVDANAVTLGESGRSRVVSWAALGAGKVQVEFNRAADGADDQEAEEG
jgi:ribosome maturation factor RimP